MAQGLTNYSSLLRKVSTQYDKALKARSLFFYPSKITVLEQQVAGPSQQPGSAVLVPWAIRCVPALLDKAKEKRGGEQAGDDVKKEEEKGQNEQDVFAPPYHSDLLVEELGDYTVLLNKFCVVPKHFLLVTRDFQPQTMPPAPSMLAVAYSVLRAHKDSQQLDGAKQGIDLLAFYNCGRVSGASQPHQHMQFAELGSEEVATVPIDVLQSALPADSKEDDVFALPLPYQHFITLIRSPPSLDAQNGKALENYLGSKLLMLIDSLFQARLLHAEESGAAVQRSQPSWNLLLSTTAMHLIPRQQEEFHGLAQRVQREGVKHEEDGVDLVGPLSINSLGYAGHLLVKSEKELEYLRDHPGGIAEVLRHTGTPPVANFTALKP